MSCCCNENRRDVLKWNVRCLLVFTDAIVDDVRYAEMWFLQCDVFPFPQACGWLAGGWTWYVNSFRLTCLPFTTTERLFFCSFFFSFSPDFVGFLICYWRNKGRGGRESWWEWNEKCAMKFAMLLWYEEEYFFVMLRDAVFFVSLQGSGPVRFCAQRSWKLFFLSRWTG